MQGLKNASFKVFVIVILKDGLTIQSYFWYDIDYRFVIWYSLGIVSVISKSFLWYDKDAFLGNMPPMQMMWLSGSQW